MAALLPRLAATGMMELVGAVDHAFTVTFSARVQDPIIHLGSLASILTFNEDPLVTRLSGDSGFQVIVKRGHRRARERAR